MENINYALKIKEILPALNHAGLEIVSGIIDSEIVRKFKHEKILFYTPHAKQKKFIDSAARTKAFIGGNRSGKTTAGAIDVILDCIGEHPLQKKGIRKKPPVYWRVVCVDFVYGIEKIIIPKIKDWIPKKYLIDGRWDKSWLERSKTLTLTNGSKIEFMSANQEREKFQGTSRDGLWVDEEIGRDIFKECQMRLIDSGGRSVLTLTPINGMSWVYDEIYLKSAEDTQIEVVCASIYDNPHIDPAEIELIAGALSDEEKKIRFYGEFVARQGLVYKEYTDRAPLVIEPVPLDPQWTRYVGIDPHLRTPTAALFCAVNNEGDIFVYDELFMDGLICDIAGVINLKLKDARSYIAVIDPASKQPNPVSGTSIKDEFARFGIVAKDAKKDVAVGINRVSRYLRLDPVYKKPKLFIFNTCVKLRSEFMHYVWDTESAQCADKQSPRKKDDHLLDCLRYIIMEEPAYFAPARKTQLRKSVPNRCGY